MSSVFTNLADRIRGLSSPAKLLIVIVSLILVYFYYVSGITQNPPGFYLDEATVAYNAYTIYQTGQSETGLSMPLYFPVIPLAPPFSYLGYLDPVQVYLMAALHYFFSPGVALARGVGATAMFLSALLLAFLAWKLSKRGAVGIIVGFTALAMPWFFEIGRLAFPAALYPLIITLLLIATLKACSKARWSLLDCIAIGTVLALTTYTYSIGRLLGPLLAFGLMILVTDLKRLRSVFITWAVYAVTLMPMLVFHLRNPNALAGRYNMSVGYISPEKGYWQIFVEFIGHFLANISPDRLFFVGDLNLRHHINDTAPVFAVTVILAIVGLVIIVLKHRRDPWWRYILYGLFVSLVPASLTKDDFHMLRLIPFPVFMIVITIPALMWIFGVVRETSDRETSKMRRMAANIAVAGLVLATVVQAISFQYKFAKIGPNRGGYFDFNFPSVFAAALEQPERPIYLPDQFYYHALWQAASQKIDPDNFVKLAPGERPPANSIVLSGEEKCTDCVMMVKDIPFVLYKTLTDGPKKILNSSTGRTGSGYGELAGPRGVAVDSSMNYYVADAGNGRVHRFDADGNFITSFGISGREEAEFKEPSGILITPSDELYVTDAGNNKLMKFGLDGNFIKEWKPSDGGFYGPRDIAMGPNNHLYIVDQGRTRIVRFDLEKEEFNLAWGTSGKGEGQFFESTGITVAGNLVIVMDTGNERIEVFDLDGKFIRQWAVPEWVGYSYRYPDAVYDEQSKKLFVTSSGTNEVLAFDLDGKPLDGIKPNEEQKLDNPSSIVIAESKTKRQLVVLSSRNPKISTFQLEAKRASAPRK